jgi:hypothetical protein
MLATFAFLALYRTRGKEAVKLEILPEVLA